MAGTSNLDTFYYFFNVPWSTDAPQMDVTWQWWLPVAQGSFTESTNNPRWKVTFAHSLEKPKMWFSMFSCPTEMNIFCAWINLFGQFFMIFWVNWPSHTQQPQQPSDNNSAGPGSPGATRGCRCRRSTWVSQRCHRSWYAINLPWLWLGMVNIPTIYGDDWGMVYGIVICMNNFDPHMVLWLEMGFPWDDPVAKRSTTKHIP